MSQQTTTFLNHFPAGPVPTPQGNPGPGFIRESVIDPGQVPGPVKPPEGLTGPIHMQSGWHQGPGVAVEKGAASQYGSYNEDDLLEHGRRHKDEELEAEILAAAQSAVAHAQSVADTTVDSAKWEAGSAVREVTLLGPKLLIYAGVTALGFAAGRKFAPMMPVRQLRDAVPTAGALAGYGVASLVNKDSKETLIRTGMLVAAAVAGAYAADILYPRR